MSAIAARVQGVLIPICLLAGASNYLQAQTAASDLDLLAKIVGIAEINSRRATGDFEQGLSVDTTSFVQLGTRALRHEILASDFLRALNRNARSTTYAQAVRCETASPRSCRVSDGGIFVRLDSLSANDSTAIAVVTVVTSRVAPSGRESVCPRELKLLFTRGAGEWTYRRRLSVATC